MNGMPLSTKQQRFVEEYASDFNATQAYKRAGYKVSSDASARSAGARLLANVSISEKISAAVARLAKTARITADEAWRELSYLAFSNIADILDMTGPDLRLKPACDIPISALRALKSVKVKRYLEGTGEDAREVELIDFTFWDKPGALTMALRALGELKEKREYSGPGDGPMQIEHSGSHDPTLDASDAAYAESLASEVTDSVVLHFAEEFREAAEQKLREAAEQNGLSPDDCKADDAATVA
jgi:phage terminase small subunit